MTDAFVRIGASIVLSICALLVNVAVTFVPIPLGFAPLIFLTVVEDYSPWVGERANVIGIICLYLAMGLIVGALSGLIPIGRRRPWLFATRVWSVIQIVLWAGSFWLVWRGYVQFE